VIRILRLMLHLRNCYQMNKCPFVVAVDSREQIPFDFSSMQMPIKGKMVEVEVETIERCLGNNSGDYQVEGIDSVTVERKSLDDLHGTLADRDAFREQIEFMNFAFRFSAVVIEASWDQVCDPQSTDSDWRSQLHPHSVVATIQSWRIRYPRVHWITPGSRRNAEVVTFDILRQAWRHSKERRK